MTPKSPNPQPSVAPRTPLDVDIDAVRVIARRAAQRAVAERARGAEGPAEGTADCTAEDAAQRARGIHAALVGPGVAAPHDLGPGPAQEVGFSQDAGPGAGARMFEPSRPRVDRAIVTGDALKQVPDGGRYLVEPGARITPLAEEEAQRRGIRFVAGRAAQLAPTGTWRIALASDHGGFRLKGEVSALLRELGHAPEDLGPPTDMACDYPDYARAVGLAVAEGRADLGVVIDGAGIGSAMAANKVPGVLAANCWDERSARNAREHNHANVLTLGAGHLDLAAARAVLVAFLGTPIGPERHARRVAKIHALEREFARAPRRSDAFDPTR